MISKQINFPVQGFSASEMEIAQMHLSLNIMSAQLLAFRNIREAINSGHDDQVVLNHIRTIVKECP